MKKTVTRERRGKKDTEPGKTTELKEVRNFWYYKNNSENKFLVKAH